MTKKALFTTLSLLCMASLRAQSEPGQSPAAATQPSAGHDAAPADTETRPLPLDPKNMDTSVKPQDDFYSYANGSWLKNNPIPPEYSRWGSFNELVETNNDALHEIAEKAATSVLEAGEPNSGKAAATDLQRVGDFYASGMNEEAINAARVKPLQNELERIAATKNREDLIKEIGHLHSIGITGAFRFTSGQDAKNSTMVIAQAYQGGLGLPDRDYYTKGRRRFEETSRAVCRACHQGLHLARRVRRSRRRARQDSHGRRDLAGQAGAHPG
jgi:predicted metalloendopeptidase